MGQVIGMTERFLLVDTSGTRTIVNYDKEIVDDVNSTWYELYFTKHGFNGKPRFSEVRDAIIDDINRRTDEKILSGFVWNEIPVWLSAENQRNFSEAQRMAEKYGDAVLPLTFKLGEIDGEPVYHTFETVAELDQFYVAAFAYVNRCLSEGWQKKDTFDFEPYKEELGDDTTPVQEPDAESGLIID